MVSDGWRFVLPSLLVGFLALSLDHYFGLAIGIVCLGFSIGCAFFFRNPTRSIVENPKLIYSPADGKVLEVVKDSEGKRKGLDVEWVVRIFLSLWDAHLQYSPIAGVVEAVEHRPGKFLDARKKEAERVNEQNRILIRGEALVAVRQIAGLLARRIVCWVRQSQPVRQGQLLGLIRFGSQVDLHLPAGVEILVQAGDRVVGGITPVARLP